MQVHQEEKNGENKESKMDNPGTVISCKAVVTRESGLQVSEPNR